MKSVSFKPNSAFFLKIDTFFFSGYFSNPIRLPRCSSRSNLSTRLVSDFYFKFLRWGKLILIYSNFLPAFFYAYFFSFLTHFLISGQFNRSRIRNEVDQKLVGQIWIQTSNRSQIGRHAEIVAQRSFGYVIGKWLFFFLSDFNNFK